LLVSIIIMGIAYKPLALLLIPLLIYRETRDWIIDLLFSTIFPGLAPRLEVLDNYVFDYRNSVAHIFYKSEPLFDIFRLSGQQYVNLVNEFTRRLSLMPNEIFTFIRLKENKYLRLSKKVEPSESGLKEFIDWVKGKEILLRQYFILSLVEKNELKRLVGFPRPPSTTRLVAFLALLDFAGFILMGIYGLAALLVLNALAIKARHNYSVIKGGELGRLSHRLSASGLLFTKPSEEDLRSIAEAFVSNNDSFMLSISGNPGFRGEVSRTVVSSHRRLIDFEDPKAVPKASQWTVVLERVNNRGEEPVKVMVALSKTSNIPLLFTSKSATQMHVWEPPSINELGWDLAAIPMFHGGRVLSESLRARILLGRDRENNELWVDLDSMPSGFGLVVGPTGMGKTWTVSTIVYRLMKSGIKVLILDPHGEYLRLPNIEPLDVTRKFVNPFGLDGVTDMERVHRLSMAFEVFGIPRDLVITDLKTIYQNGLYKGFFKSMEWLRARSDNELFSLALDRLMSYLGDVEIVPVDVLLDNKALLFGSVKSSPDLMSFLMGVVMDHVHTYMMSQSISERLQQLLVIDEAYFVLGNPLMEYIVRGARKFGLGTIMVSQTITGIDTNVLQNIPLMIVLGGSDAYVNEVAKVLNLTNEDIKWLTTALPPHMAGLTTKALIITGPIKRQATIELEPAVKGLVGNEER